MSRPTQDGPVLAHGIQDNVIKWDELDANSKFGASHNSLKFWQMLFVWSKQSFGLSFQEWQERQNNHLFMKCPRQHM